MEKIIIYDSSVLSLSFLRQYGRKSTYADFDTDVLIQKNKEVQYVLDLFRDKNARTIPDVSHELNDLVAKLSRGKKLFSKPQSIPKGMPGSKYVASSLKKSKKNERLFDELHQNVFDVYTQSKKIHLRNKIHNYNPFLSFTKKVAQDNHLCNFSLTRNSSFKHYKATDRELIAHAYDQVFNHGNQVILSTRDMDMMRLNLAVRSKLLNADIVPLTFEKQKVVLHNPVLIDLVNFEPKRPHYASSKQVRRAYRRAKAKLN